MTHPHTFRLPAEIAEMLAALAKANHATKTAVIVRLIQKAHDNEKRI